MKKSVVILLVLVVLQCAWGATAAAQSSNPCQSTFVVSFSGFVPKGWNCVGWGYFVFLSVCTVPNTKCAPPPPPGGGGCPSCSNPISLATGNTYFEQTDLK